MSHLDLDITEYILHRISLSHQDAYMSLETEVGAYAMQHTITDMLQNHPGLMLLTDTMDEDQVYDQDHWESIRNEIFQLFINHYFQDR